MSPESMQPDVPLHEKDLLQRIAKGDEEAFHRLFDAYRNRLYFYTLQITGSKELAEDTVQDTFLRIWLHREQLLGVVHFNAYIFRIARNGVLNGFRRKALEATIIRERSEQQQYEPEAEEKLHFKLVRSELQKAVDALPQQQRRVYLLRREEGRPIKEIAALLDISEITVKRHLTQAQKQLRQVIENRFPFESGILLIIFGLLS